MDGKTGSGTGLTRRSLLINAGKYAAGVAGSTVLAAPGLSSKAEASGGSTEKWPWPYVKLDPEKTAEMAYHEWYRVFCGAAVINSVFSQLREKVGGPYTSFPGDAFVFLEGGMAGWGTICGSNAGANIVSNVIIGPRTAGPDCVNGALIGSEMLQWYSENPLPAYTPKQPKQKNRIILTTSQSPLCHVSVGKWMKESGYALSSPERRDRCARVTASVAFKLVQDLNAWKDGKYESKAGWTPAIDFGITSQQNCMECHGDKIPAGSYSEKMMGTTTVRALKPAARGKIK